MTMNASDLLKLTKSTPYRDEINTFSSVQIEERLVEYANEGKASAPFYGIISETLKENLKSKGFIVIIYNNSTLEPMTTISCLN